MRYIGTPFTLSLLGVPQPADGAVPTVVRTDGVVRMPEVLAIRGVSTLPTSSERAKREAGALVRQCQERVAAGRAGAILDLLDMNPGFIQHFWVRETYVRLSAEGRLRRVRGRPIGRDKVCPIVVVGLVGHLIDTGRVKNREQAFGKLEELGFITYAAAKDSFYRGWREPRFRAIYLEFPELEREMTAAEVAYFRRAERVEAGRTAKRTFEDPQLGRVDFGLRGF